MKDFYYNNAVQDYEEMKQREKDEAREFANSYDGDVYYFLYGDEAEHR